VSAMKAFGYRTPGPIDAPESLVALELPVPQPGPRDIRVAVQAISVNPADVKLRASVRPAGQDYRVLGFDAAGVVDAVGTEVSSFKVGDEVFYAGAINRSGTNAELHLVDERIAGRKPRTLSFSEAAALPLTSLTAWEILFERLGVRFGEKRGHDRLLVINGAGGVGSILIQLARRLTGLTVIVTASRPESIEWCQKMGAHHVIDHHSPFLEQLHKKGIDSVRYVAGLTGTDKHLQDIESVLAPQGALALIDDPAVLDIMPLKRKSVSVHWELMFTRSLYQTADMVEQQHILNEVADLVDAGVLRTTVTQAVQPINLANLKRVHVFVESDLGIGKSVLTGFEN